MHEDARVSPWRATLRVVVLWLLLCSGIGLLAAFASGEFGSIIYLMTGVVVGLSGAITHAALLRAKSFRSGSGIRRVLWLWVGATVLPAIWVILGELTSVVPVKSLRSDVILFLCPILAIALLGACALNQLDRREQA